MNRTEARRIHAHFAASTRLAIMIPLGAFALATASGVPLADAVALLAAAMAFTATVAAFSTDMMSRRIPNGLSLVALGSGPVWWLAMMAGSGLPGLSGDGVAWSVIAPIYGVDGSGSVLPALLSVSYPARIGLDLVMFVVVLVPLYMSFALGLGFGGGDVKLMAALAPFFGWPLGFDFFLLTFIFGGVISVPVILGRIFARGALRMGASGPVARKWAEMREFPFAPAIAVAAMICLSTKLEGL